MGAKLPDKQRRFWPEACVNLDILHLRVALLSLVVTVLRTDTGTSSFHSGGKFWRLPRVLLCAYLGKDHGLVVFYLMDCFNQINKLPARNRLNCAQMLKTALGLCAVNFRSSLLPLFFLQVLSSLCSGKKEKEVRTRGGYTVEARRI